MGRIFGTDGVRGIAGRQLDIELATNIGRAAAMVVADKLGRQPTFTIGKDTRLSSDMLEAAVIAGLCSVGANVIRLGVVPTPAVAYLTCKYHADAGVMLSASHNSYEYNGVKIFGGDGFKLTDEQEEEIEDIILDKTRPYPSYSHDQIGCVSELQTSNEDYIEYIASKASEEPKGQRVLIDCSNGSAAVTAKEIFTRIGLEFDLIAATPDGININKDCGSTHMDRLAKQVMAGGYTMGFAFDGDADRFLAVDHLGRMLDGDKLISIYSSYLQSHGGLHKDTIVVTTMSNMGLLKLMERRGIAVKATKVGDRYVLQEMREGGYSIGGEQSGHMIFFDHSTTGDGQLSAVMLLNAVAQSGKSLAELGEEMTTYPQILLNVTATPEMKAILWENRELSKLIDDIEDSLKDRGRVLIRVSGTEPVIRVMVEGEDKDEITRAAHTIADAITEYLK